MAEGEQRVEFLEAFYGAWIAWDADPSYATERPVREIAKRLREQELDGKQ